jgi:uncharacterized membrane protein YebE (DUF533 family)
MFDAKKLLNDVLGQVSQTAGKTLNVPAGSAGGRDAMMKGLGGGALGGLLAGLLLGTKSGRKVGGGALKLGALAAIGTLAYKAYQDWQGKSQGSVGGPSAPGSLPAPAEGQMTTPPDVLLRAMIAAAKADGHVDASERANILAEVDRLGLGADGRTFFEAELAKPVDSKEIASLVSSPQMAAEVYAISVIVAGDQSAIERSYLNNLAAALNLAPELAQTIENDLKAA